MTAMDEKVALVVNAGGMSRRMGQNKALLAVPPDATPLVVHVIRRLAPLARAGVVVVSNDAAVGAAVAALPAVQVLGDHWPDGGALGGVATGLRACAGWAMVVACDMPLVSPVIFAKLLVATAQRPTVGAVIPRIAGEAQPFHGVWHRRTLPVLEQQLAAGQLRVQAALAQCEVLWLDEDALGIRTDDPAFANANLPEEWRTLLAILAEQNRPVV